MTKKHSWLASIWKRLCRVKAEASSATGPANKPASLWGDVQRKAEIAKERAMNWVGELVKARDWGALCAIDHDGLDVTELLEREKYADAALEEAGADAVPAIISQMQVSQRGGARDRLVGLLAKSRDERGIKPVLALMSQFEWIGTPAIAKAVDYLVEVAPHDVFPVLLTYLTDKSYEDTGPLPYGLDHNRQQAVRGLGLIGSEEATPHLISALYRNDRIEKYRLVRYDVENGLGKAGTDYAQSVLTTWKMERANAALAQLKRGFDSSSVSCLATLGDERCIELLLAHFKSCAAHPGLQDGVVNFFVRTAPERAVPLLVSLLDDAYGPTRTSVARGLGLIGSQSTLPALRAALVRYESSIAEGLRRAKTDFAMHLLESWEAERAASLDIAKMSESTMLQYLRQLCVAYAEDTTVNIERLEPVAASIGKELNRRGGLGLMRSMHARLQGLRGSRTLEMHWDGIGDWHG